MSTTDSLALINGCLGEVQFLTPSTGAVEGVVQLSCAQSVNFDAYSGLVWAADPCNGDIYGINPLNFQVVSVLSSGDAEECLDYAIATGSNATVVALDTCEDRLYFFSDPSGEYLGEVGLEYGCDVWDGMMFLPSDGEVYVPSDCDYVNVVSLTAMTQVSTLLPADDVAFAVADPVTGQGFLVAYDGAVYSVDPADNALTYIAAATQTCIESAAFSSTSQYLYLVENCGYNDVEVLDPATSTFVATPTVVAEPQYAIASPLSPGDVYVTSDEFGYSVLEYEATLEVTNVPLALGCPWLSAYDPNVNDVFIMDSCLGPALEVVDASTNTLVATTTVSGLECPQALVFDAADDALWVSDSCTANVFEISDSSPYTVTTVAMPDSCLYSMADDPLNATLFVSDECNGEVYAVNTETDAVSTFISDANDGSVGCWYGLQVDLANFELYGATCDSAMEAFSIPYDQEVGGTFGEVCYGYQSTFDSTDNLLAVIDGCEGDVVDFFSTTTNSEVGSTTVLGCAWPFTWDPVNDLVYVASECGGGQVETVNPLTLQLAGSDELGASSVRLATLSASSETGDVYAVNDGQNPSVLVLDTQSNEVTATLDTTFPAFCDADSVAADSSNGLVYATNECYGNVSVIAAATHAILGAISLPAGACPIYDVFDAQTQDVYVSDPCNDAIDVISASTESVVAVIPFPTGEDGGDFGMAVGNGVLYLADSSSEQVVVISTSSNQIVGEANLPGECPDPEFVTVDPQTGFAYATDACDGIIDEVSSGGTVVNSVYIADLADIDYSCPYGITFVPSMDDIAVADPCNGAIWQINPQSLELIGETEVDDCPLTVAFDPANQLLYAGNDYCSDNGYTVSAIEPTTDAVLTIFPMGTDYEPWAMSFDQGTGELYVGTWGDDVEVISTVLGVGAASLSTGSFGSGATFAAADDCEVLTVVVGQVLFSGDACDPTVFAYNLADGGALLSTITLPGDGWIAGLTYDPGTGLIYAVDPYDGPSIGVIDPQSASLVEVFNEGSYLCYPGAITPDSFGDLWVYDACEEAVLEFNAYTGAYVGEVSVPTSDDWLPLSYDAAAQSLFLSSDDMTYVIDAATASYLGSFPTTVGCPAASAVGTVDGFAILVIGNDGCGDNLLTAYAAATGTFLGEIDITNSCTWIGGVTFDPISGEIAAVDECNGDVDLVDVVDGQLSQPLVEEDSCLEGISVESYDDSFWATNECPQEFQQVLFQPTPSAGPSDTVEVGQYFEVQSDLWGPGALDNSVDIAVAPQQGVLECGSQAQTPALGGTEMVGCTATGAGTATVWLNTTDADGSTVSSWVTVQVLNALSVGTPIAVPASGDQGQTVTISAQAMGGTGIYTSYAWTYATISSWTCTPITSTASTLSCVLGNPGTYTLQAQATDSGGVISPWSPALTFVVSAVPEVFSTYATVGEIDPAYSADVGQTVNFYSEIYSSLNLAFSWSGLPAGCTNGNVWTITCTPTTPGTYDITVTATDSNGYTVVAPIFTFVVYGDPVLSNIVASQPSGDVGQTVTFSVLLSGGSGGNSYAWGTLSSCSGADTSVMTCTLTAADVGVQTLSVSVNDSNGVYYSPSVFSFTVYADPAASAPTASASSGDVGQTVVFSTVASGGTSVYTGYAWSGLPGVCSGTTTATATCVLTATGSFLVSASVTDSNGESSAASPALTFVVGNAPVVSTPTAVPSSADVGQSASVDFSTSVTGGVGPYTYVWSGLPAGCTGTTTVVAVCPGASFTSAGTLLITVQATDANGISSAVSATLAFVVYSDPTVSVSVSTFSGLAAGDVGQVVSFTASASGGAGSYTYAWTTTLSSCTGAATSTLTCTLRAADVGSKSFSVVATDANGVAASSGSRSFTVSTDPVAGMPVGSASAGTVGQTLTFSSALSGGTGTFIGITWFGLPGVCSGATSSSVVTCVLTASGTFTVTVQVIDSNGAVSALSPALSFVVSSAPTVSTPTANASSADVGGSLTLSATATGGAAPLSYTWSGLPVAGCTGLATATPDCTFASAGTLSVTVTVTDANGVKSATSGTLVVAVFSDPAVSTPTANRTSSDPGQWVSFTASVAGGSGGYTYLWSGLPATGCSGTTSLTVSCLLSTAGALSVVLSVWDSNHGFAASAPLTFTVNSPLAVATPSASVNGIAGATAADVDQTVTLETSASGGSGSYPTFAWTGLDGAACSGMPGATISCQWSVAGTYTVTAWATDSLGSTAASAESLTLTISPPPQASGSAAISASVSALDVGQTVSFKATPSGGDAPWTITWSGLPAGCTSKDTAALSCSPTAPGFYLVSYTAVDANGATVVSSAVGVQVNPVPSVSVSLSVSQNTAQTGSAITFVASVTGGTGAITYSWAMGDGTSLSGSTVSYAYAKAGTYTVTVTVTDASGASNTASVTVSIVSPPAASPTVLGTSPSAGYLLLGLLALVIFTLAMVGAMYFMRRKKGGSEGGEKLAPVAGGGSASGKLTPMEGGKDTTAPSPEGSSAAGDATSGSSAGDFKED